MNHTVIVAGVGMIPFAKPGASEPYHVMGEKATRLALADAGVDYKAIQQAFVGYVYGDSTCGQRALYPVGMTGIPVLNVNNNCSTGSSALFLARQAVQSGAADCVLALGFEQMQPGAIKAAFTDRPTPFEEFDQATDALVDELRSFSPLAQRTAKKLLNDTEDSPLAIAIELEGHCYSRLRSSEDFREGVEAFHAKRKPKFTGR